jgi:hypothetical protein
MFYRHFLKFCFAIFVVQNLPARGRKTEKNKEMAKLQKTKCQSYKINQIGESS